MLSVGLALGAAVLYGLSDFLGGLLSRRGALWPTGVLSCTGALAGAVVLAAVLPGDPHGPDFGWAALAGLGGGTGTAFLYRGLAAGRMGVVAPVSAVGSAVIPLAAGLLDGDRPGAWAWAGIALALPGIWLVSREQQAAGAASVGAAGLVDGLLAGVGFGALFAAIGQVPQDAGYWPLALSQVFSVLAVAGIAVALGGRPLPRATADLTGLLPGVLASVAVLLFLLATTHGLLSVAAIVTSLYPAFTVLLAIALLREHVHRGQGLGLALCATAVVLVGLG